MLRLHLALYLVFTFLGMCYCEDKGLGVEVEGKKKKVELVVDEEGMTFKEIFTIDEENNRFEYIEVPQHGESPHVRPHVILLIDTETHNVIRKIPEMKMCYVLKTDGHEDKPLDEGKSIDSVGNKFPYHHYTVNRNKVLITGDVDATTDIGKIAGNFCKGDYQIKNAEYFEGDGDETDYVNKLLQSYPKKVIIGYKDTKRTKRDVAIRDFVMYSCSEADSEHAINEVTRCGGVIDNVRATCAFRRNSCTYRVKCDFDDSLGTHVCRGDHDLNSIICCTYACNNPANVDPANANPANANPANAIPASE